MKVRSGFVSNSSSSSFIIAYKDKKLAKDRLLVLLGAIPGSAASKLLEPLAKMIAHTKKATVKSLCEEFFVDDKEALREEGDDAKRSLELLESGWMVIILEVSNESDDPVSQWLYAIGISVKTDDFVMFGASA